MDSKFTVAEKFEEALKLFASEKICCTSSSALDRLIFYLSQKDHAYLLSDPVLNWIEKCADCINCDFKCLHPNILYFMLKITGLVVNDKWEMNNPLLRLVLEKIASVAENNIQHFTPLISLGHIQLMSALSNNSLGIQWLKSSKSWRYLIGYCMRGHTMYIVREASSLIFKLIHSFSVNSNDEPLCLEVLGVILKPIDQNVYEDTSLIGNIDNKETQQILCSTLDLISHIFQQILKCNEKISIPHLIETHHKLESNLWKLAEMTRNETLLGKILKAQTSYNFATLIYEKWEKNEIEPLDFNHFGINFFNTMKFCLVRRGCVNFLKLAKFNHYLWKMLGSKRPFEICIENESIQFENQLTMFHVMPVLYIVKVRHEEESIFDNYLMKLFSISSEFTVRICSSFRDILLDCPESAAHLTYKSIHGILSMKSILNKEQAVVVFQALVYALNEFSFEAASVGLISEEPHMKEDLVLNIPRVLYATLVCLHTLIEEYNITWKGSIESTCIMDIVLNILKNPRLSSMIVVRAIKLIQLSVEHFLSPTMALLVDNIRGSALQNLAQIVKYNFNCKDWEVRDTTIELVTSVVSISRLKFPAFQQYILDNNLCYLVYSITRNDEEQYVRVSGLKCLTQMIAVNLFWEKVILQFNIIEYLLHTISNDKEGPVRKEAITCVTQMLVYHRINSNCDVYRTVAYSTVTDLFWEVKVAALHFWDVAIYLQFTNQGMIDGTFPTVTFSKENKKIITLTESETILRIRKVLNELAEIGFLGVALICLNDDSDLEVVTTASRIIKNLFEKLDKYEYKKAFFEDDCNEIRSDQMKQSVQNVSIGPQGRIFFVSPKKFINKIKDVNLDKLIVDQNQSVRCLENISSLINDIICSMKVGKPVDKDCY